MRVGNCVNGGRYTIGEFMKVSARWIVLFVTAKRYEISTLLIFG